MISSGAYAPGFSEPLASRAHRTCYHQTRMKKWIARTLKFLASQLCARDVRSLPFASTCIAASLSTSMLTLPWFSARQFGPTTFHPSFGNVLTMQSISTDEESAQTHLHRRPGKSKRTYRSRSRKGVRAGQRRPACRTSLVEQKSHTTS